MNLKKSNDFINASSHKVWLTHDHPHLHNDFKFNLVDTCTQTQHFSLNESLKHFQCVVLYSHKQQQKTFFTIVNDGCRESLDCL